MAYDREKGGMSLEWANKEDFWAWLAAEELEKAIELIVSQIKRSDSLDWWERHMLRCSREFMGGKSKYQKKNEWERKIPLKTSCQCCLTIKRYPYTETILGRYDVTIGLVRYASAAYHWDCLLLYVIPSLSQITRCITRLV